MPVDSVAQAWRQKITKRIKEARHAKGYATVKQWSKFSQFEEARLRGWDSGQRCPDNWNIELIAAELGVSSCYLAGFEEKAQEGAPRRQPRQVVVDTDQFSPDLQLWDSVTFEPAAVITGGYYVCERAGQLSVWLVEPQRNGSGRFVPHWSESKIDPEWVHPDALREAGYTPVGKAVSVTRPL